jgi:hypothetical protein
MESDVIAYYHQGALTGEDLQAAIDSALLELSSVDVELGQFQRNSDDTHKVRFVVVQEGGFIAEGILIGIAIGAGSNITADAVKALWEKVLKRVKASHGGDAVGPEEPGTRHDLES